MSLATREEVERQVTLTKIESRHNAEYEVVRKSDGLLLGTVVRKHFSPDVNYKGTRIRKIFKGGQKWFAVLPFAKHTNGPCYWRMDRDTRWKAVELLLTDHQNIV